MHIVVVHLSHVGFLPVSSDETSKRPIAVHRLRQSGLVYQSSYAVKPPSAVVACRVDAMMSVPFAPLFVADFHGSCSHPQQLRHQLTLALECAYAGMTTRHAVE